MTFYLKISINYTVFHNVSGPVPTMFLITVLVPLLTTFHHQNKICSNESSNPMIMEPLAFVIWIHLISIFKPQLQSATKICSISSVLLLQIYIYDGFECTEAQCGMHTIISGLISFWYIVCLGCICRSNQYKI